MKIVIAMDSFKGSVSSIEAGQAVREGILKEVTGAEIIVKALADGGEGTIEALTEGCGGGRRIPLSVRGPAGTLVQGEYGLIHEKTAVIEVAKACGLPLIPGRKTPLAFTSYGVGEFIRNAIGRGIRDFLIGLGGTATNDCGLGMLTALGYEFLDSQGQAVGISAGELGKIESIDDRCVIPGLEDCRFRVMCDVSNPLCGPQGATWVFGPQKGVESSMLETLDCMLARFAGLSQDYRKVFAENCPGAGAAGGLGFAFMCFLNAEMVSGAEYVIRASGLEEAMKGSYLVFTGEGRLDGQSVMGKGPGKVASLAKKQGAVVVAFAGSLGEDASSSHRQGIDAFFSIQQGPCTPEEAMTPERTLENLKNLSGEIMRLLLVNEKKGMEMERDEKKR